MKAIISIDKKIINTLFLNASFIDNLGLLHGKMGIVIYFFHLARETDNPIYEDYAGELIDQISYEIRIKKPLDFENGLAGIGWGIEYLEQKGFIDTDTNEILEKIDARIMQVLIYNPPHSIGLTSGLAGFGAYLVRRICNSIALEDEISAMNLKQLTIHLVDEFERCFKVKSKQMFFSPNYFDILSDYSMWLWILVDLFDLDIYNYKVSNLLQSLVALYEIEELPSNYGNRLILLAAIERVRKCDMQKWIDNPTNLEQCKNQLNEIANPISMSNIKFSEAEMEINGFDLHHGTSGIILANKLLHCKSEDDIYYEKKIQWEELTDDILNKLPNTFFANADLGLLNGVGCNLLSLQ